MLGTAGGHKNRPLNNIKPQRSGWAGDYYISRLISYFLGQALASDEAQGARLVPECCFQAGHAPEANTPALCVPCQL